MDTNWLNQKLQEKIAYTYKADILCKRCGNEAQRQSIAWLFKDFFRNRITNAAMEQFHEWLEENPHMYDSDDYPKVFLISQSDAVDCSVCYQCGEPVDPCPLTCQIESCIVCEAYFNE